MIERQQRAIIDFFLHRIDKEALNAELGFDADNDCSGVFGLLDDAVRDEDAASVACALALAQGRTGDLDVVPTLIVLLRAPWHTKHEDVARWLQDLRDPRAVDALYETALTKHGYLEYNDSRALARKCTWALADIGTVDAQQRLQRLARAEDQEVAGYAQKRLDKWAQETGRKGRRLPGHEH